MSGEINSCADLCAFIRANQDSPELVERALSNPDNLAKIQDGDQLDAVIRALVKAGASELIPRVLTDEILAKIEDEFQLYCILFALNQASRFDLTPRVLTDEILGKIDNVYWLNSVIELLNDASHVAIVLASEVIRRNFSAVCEPGFANRFDQALKPLVVEAFEINRWSETRSAFFASVLRAPGIGAGAPAGGAGASAPGGVGVTAFEPTL
jgi:hypothetical protein